MDEETIEKYRKAGKIAKAAREYGASKVKEGVLLFDVAEYVEEFIWKQGGRPAFPINLALNDAAAHFTPGLGDDTIFQKGDVVKLDVGVQVDGYIGDTAVTIEVGTNHWGDLIRATEEALEAAIGLMKPNARVDDVGAAIQRIIESHNFVPIENLTGHSMERYKLHAGLSVPNVMGEGSGIVKAQDVIAIEPFATNGAGMVDGKKGGNIYRLIKPRPIGGRELKALIKHINENYSSLPFSERWCHKYDKKAKQHIRKLLRAQVVYSYPLLKDVGGGIVAQSEHTVIITEDGCEIIT
ncbi:MAG: type II methionyl aminopeptidase [Methanomassiliicoccales archaeon]|nr:MAG: type II methionyl aminopeptidase [Methanomassiliicoccales archaeon]